MKVLPNDPAAQQLDVSSAMVEPIGHEITSTNADHCETLSFLGHCVSYDEDDPCFSSNHVHPDMLSHVVEPPSAATHFSSKFHLTATAPHPLSVGAQALTSAQVPCAQPWLCRIGANDSWWNVPSGLSLCVLEIVSSEQRAGCSLSPIPAEYGIPCGGDVVFAGCDLRNLWNRELVFMEERLCL